MITDEKIQEIVERHFEMLARAGSVVDVRTALKEAIREALSAQWVDVNERLPDKYVDVFIATVKGVVMGSGFINDMGDWLSEFEPTKYTVTHWMPIPEPPKQ